MEMLNIPPAKPQPAPTAPSKTGAGKDTDRPFEDVFNAAGINQRAGQQAKAKTATDNEEAEQGSPEEMAVGAEALLTASLPTDTQQGAELETTLFDPTIAAELSVSVAGGAPMASEGTISVSGNEPVGQGSKVGQGGNALPLPAAAVANATAQQALAGTEPATATAAMAQADLLAAAGQPGAPASGNAPSEQRATAADPSLQPVALATAEQMAKGGVAQQATTDPVEGSKQSGLLESSLSGILRETQPLRGDLRGRSAVDNSRGVAPNLAVPTQNSLQAGTEAQNEDALSSFASEKGADLFSSASAKTSDGATPATDGAPFGTVLENGLHAPQATPGGQHPLQQTQSHGVAEPGTIRLASGEYLSENRIIDQVLQRIPVEQVGDKSRLVIKMYPEELGEIKLALTMENDQLRAQLLTQNRQVQEVLEKHLPRLQQALDNQGVRLEDIQVTVDSDRNPGREFAEHQRQPDVFRRPFNAPAENIANASAMAASTAARSGSERGLSLRV